MISAVTSTAQELTTEEEDPNSRRSEDQEIKKPTIEGAGASFRIASRRPRRLLIS
jgi:hypothetical protein